MRPFSPSAERNREPIAGILSSLLQAPRSIDELPAPHVLEIASGTGQHAAYFTEKFPHVIWRPTDYQAESVEVIQEYRAELPTQVKERLLPPLALDVRQVPWELGGLNAPAYALIVCINMLHISPWSAAVGLFGGGKKALRPGGALFTYGPYRFSGVFTAESNHEFDLDLKRRNPEWGVRDLSQLKALAAEHQFELEAVHPLPANNHGLVWRLRDA